MNQPTRIRKVQILLHDDCKTDNEVCEARRLVEEAGMTVSGQGVATLSARMPDGAFKKLFATATAGRSLAVPECLKPFVSSISEAPDHLDF